MGCSKSRLVALSTNVQRIAACALEDLGIRTQRAGPRKLLKQYFSATLSQGEPRSYRFGRRGCAIVARRFGYEAVTPGTRSAARWRR